MAFIINRSKKEPMSEINVTPFVDVMLVLLIIFMVIIIKSVNTFGCILVNLAIH